MNFLKKYYINTRTFHCYHCHINFTVGFWRWIGTLFHNDITRHRYVKCPFCGGKHWRQAIKVVK